MPNSRSRPRARLGVDVYKPLSEHGRADLVIDVCGRLLKIQCKWARLEQDSSVVVPRVGGSRIGTNGRVLSTYSEDEIDFFGLYCGDLDRSFLMPCAVVAGKQYLHLRLTHPRNNQRACINIADPFDFVGAVAQLGERVAGSHEVRGSIPLSSTSTEAVTVGVNAFRDGLGVWLDRVAAGEEVILTRHGRPKIRMLPAVS